MTKQTDRVDLLYSIIFAQQEYIQMLNDFVSMVDSSDMTCMYLKSEDGSTAVRNLSEVRQETIDLEYELFLHINRLFEKLDELDSETAKKV